MKKKKKNPRQTRLTFSFSYHFKAAHIGCCFILQDTTVVRDTDNGCSTMMK